MLIKIRHHDPVSRCILREISQKNILRFIDLSPVCHLQDPGIELFFLCPLLLYRQFIADLPLSRQDQSQAPDHIIDHTHKIILFNSHVTSSFHYTLIANLITPSCFFSKIS